MAAETSPNTGPGAVGADQKVRSDDVAVSEGHRMPSLAQRPGAGGLGAPTDGAFGERVQEQGAQLPTIDLGAVAGAVVLVLYVDRAVGVCEAHRLPARVDDRPEQL